MNLVDLPVDAGTCALVALVFVLASLVRATFGFGDALVALPLLTALLGPRIAVPLVTGVGLALTLLLSIQLRREVQWATVGRMLAGGAIGIPIGVLGLKHLPVYGLKLGLGLLLVLVASRELLRRRPPRVWARPVLAPVFGLFAGVLDGMLGTAGPPVAIYAAGTAWTPNELRATLQAIFLPLTVLAVGGHLLAGLWVSSVPLLAGIGLGPILVGAWLGGRIAPRIPADRFRKALYLLLGGLGLFMLLPP